MRVLVSGVALGGLACSGGVCGGLGVVWCRDMVGRVSALVGLVGVQCRQALESIKKD